MYRKPLACAALPSLRELAACGTFLIAVATLATDRALLLLGVPGTAKTWVSEHLAAAISGDSTLLVQGTAGTTEETLRYGWNYARLLAEGPSRSAMVPSPMMVAMETGRICRIEELTRIPSEVQDALITILSSKTLAELTDAKQKEIMRLQIKKRLSLLLKTEDLTNVFYTDFVLQ